MDKHDDPFGSEDATTPSDTRRGEELEQGEKEAGRTETGTRGASERPAGISNARDFTGIAPEEPVTRDDEVAG